MNKTIRTTCRVKGQFILLKRVLLFVNFLTVFLLYIKVYYSNIIIYSVILLYIIEYYRYITDVIVMT